MKTNTHGLKMTGLRKASGETKDLQGSYGAGYIQVSYDTNSGEIITNYHYDLGQNSWTRYPDSCIRNIGNISSPATMQHIADMIFEELQRRELLG